MRNSRNDLVPKYHFCQKTHNTKKGGTLFVQKVANFLYKFKNIAMSTFNFRSKSRTSVYVLTFHEFWMCLPLTCTHIDASRFC